MPRIRMTFNENEQIRVALQQHVKTIQQMFAEELGYPVENVVLIPEPIPECDQKIAANTEMLTFSVTVGSRAIMRAGAHCNSLVKKIAALEVFNSIPFTILLKPRSGMVLSAHTPEQHKP